MGTTEAATAQPLLRLTQRRSVWVRRPGMHACAHTLTYAHTGRRTRTHAHTCALHTHTRTRTRAETPATRIGKAFEDGAPFACSLSAF